MSYDYYYDFSLYSILCVSLFVQKYKYCHVCLTWRVYRHEIFMLVLLQTAWVGVLWWTCLHKNWRACDILYVCLLLFFNMWVCLPERPVWHSVHLRARWSQREVCVVSARRVNSKRKLTVSHRNARFCPQLSTHSRNTALLLTSALSTRHCLPKHHITHPGMINLSKTHPDIIHWLCMCMPADL